MSDGILALRFFDRGALFTEMKEEEKHGVRIDKGMNVQCRKKGG